MDLLKFQKINKSISKKYRDLIIKSPNKKTILINKSKLKKLKQLIEI